MWDPSSGQCDREGCDEGLTNCMAEVTFVAKAFPSTALPFRVTTAIPSTEHVQSANNVGAGCTYEQSRPAARPGSRRPAQIGLTPNHASSKPWLPQANLAHVLWWSATTSTFPPYSTWAIDPCSHKSGIRRSGVEVGARVNWCSRP